MAALSPLPPGAIALDAAVSDAASKDALGCMSPRQVLPGTTTTPSPRVSGFLARLTSLSTSVPLATRTPPPEAKAASSDDKTSDNYPEARDSEDDGDSVLEYTSDEDSDDGNACGVASSGASATAAPPSPASGKLWSKEQFPEGQKGFPSWDLDNIRAAQVRVHPHPNLPTPPTPTPPESYSLTPHRRGIAHAQTDAIALARSESA
jgi:hypothetical protein